MEISVSDFKAKCLSLIGQVNQTGEAIIITKHGKWVAELRPKRPQDMRPLDKLRGTLVHFEDPFAPSVNDFEISSEL